jgi:glutamine phosphoribosylpyrophosphate amidotransferase
MCGVLGAQIHNVTDADLTQIRNLFRETRIRGKHATGVTFLKQGELHTIKEPIPADEFILKYNPADWVDEGNITFIAHARYSTSDLRYNQPIADDTLSVVHNGVISQESPDSWLDLYGIECETKNDSELLFHTLQQGHTPDYWKDASISTIWLTKEGSLQYNRNGKRPLWAFEDTRSLILTSTKDIAKRAGIIYGSRRVNCEGRDLQPVL